ncbi:MAG TPA: cytochrome P450, partial [Steroidobacteraceae bacterium]
MINSSETTVAHPVLPAPVPPRDRLSVWQFLNALRDSTISTFSQDAYELDIVSRKVFGHDLFVLSDPVDIKRVLLDHVANYEKTEITRRILEPGLGKGLITLEGDTWKSHRRTMAPSFDLRSVGSYTPIMTAAAEELMVTWRTLGAGACIDVADAMMEVTLNIISRTMFSSDSDDIMSIMGHAAGRYQATVLPNILDLLGVPEWLAGLGRSRAAHRAFAEFDTVIDRLIESRVRDSNNAPKDLLARLIAA